MSYVLKGPCEFGWCSCFHMGSAGHYFDLTIVGVPTVSGALADVIDISSSDEENDVVMLPSDLEDDEDEEDASNSGSHTNDAMNQPDIEGRVLVNVGHPLQEPDIFLAPQLALAVKPHQVSICRSWNIPRCRKFAQNLMIDNLPMKKPITEYQSWKQHIKKGARSLWAILRKLLTKGGVEVDIQGIRGPKNSEFGVGGCNDIV